MKKNVVWSLLLVILLSITLVGCGDSTKDKSDEKLSTSQTIKCTKEEVDEDGYKTVETMTITTKKNLVKKVSSVNVMELDPEYIDFTLTFGQAFAEKFNEIEGISMKYEKDTAKTIKLTMSVDYDKINPEQIKTVLGDSYDEEDATIYNSKDLTFEEFKKDNLEGYTCDK